MLEGAQTKTWKKGVSDVGEERKGQLVAIGSMSWYRKKQITWGSSLDPSGFGSSPNKEMGS